MCILVLMKAPTINTTTCTCTCSHTCQDYTCTLQAFMWSHTCVCTDVCVCSHHPLILSLTHMCILVFGLVPTENTISCNPRVVMQYTDSMCVHTHMCECTYIRIYTYMHTHMDCTPCKDACTALLWGEAQKAMQMVKEAEKGDDSAVLLSQDCLDCCIIC